MGVRFNPPPGWPAVPKGWLPPPGWRPDPSWPPAPANWPFYRRTGLPGWAKTVIGICVAGLVSLGFAYMQGEQASDDAPKVGDCAHKVGKNEIERVDCNDPASTYL